MMYIETLKFTKFFSSYNRFYEKSEFWMQICLHLLCRSTWEWCFKVLGPSRGSHTVIWEGTLYLISSLIWTPSTSSLWQSRHVLPASRSSYFNSFDDVAGSIARMNWGNWFRGEKMEEKEHERWNVIVFPNKLKNNLHSSNWKTVN